MIQGILGRKLGMTRLFDETGAATATTIVEVGPCFVTQIKTIVSDGYEAVQLGFDQVRPNKLTRPQRGHLKNGVPAVRTLREVPVTDVDAVNMGDRVDAGLLQPGERVDVTGQSKGKGFAGVMKRHNFRGGPKTHGQSDRWRAPGSIGSGTTPGRVLKGLKMAGHMGDERVTVQNLEVLRVDAERNLVALRGAVPGPNGALVMIRKKQVVL
ncbi:MAG: 50S ribosomal protein L3 [Chloroflexi bacterium]|nr:50S ribosomal protein L3 [Chloroflexota bacterium]